MCVGNQFLGRFFTILLSTRQVLMTFSLWFWALVKSPLAKKTQLPALIVDSV